MKPSNALGSLIATAGGILTELAYLTMPVATLPLIGSITAGLALLHVVPIAAAGIIGLGLWLRLGNPSRTVAMMASIGILVCSMLIAVAYLVPYNSLNSDLEGSWASALGISATSFTGGGFWIALIGTIIASIGAIIELVGVRTLGHS
jgi:hypothetical protein